MTHLHEADSCRFNGAEELGEELATLAETHDYVDTEKVATVQDSSTPLEQPLFLVENTWLSASEVIRIELTSAVEDHLDSVYSFGRGGRVDPSHFSVRTHPELLDQTTRIFSKPAAALAYRFGYVPSGLKVLELGGVAEHVEFDVEYPWEFRDFTLRHNPEELVSDTKQNHVWFDDAAAVNEFAEYATDDTIDWGQYTEWFYTHTIPSYRLDHEAHTRDWSELPPIPAADPSINPRFKPRHDPAIGDFIRYAILQHLETALPSVTAINTGPIPWQTDRDTLFIDPVSVQAEGMSGEMLCPKPALVKLGRLGYRPVDGWFESPVVGYTPDDPDVQRRIEFARGDALREWVIQTLAGKFEFDLAGLLNQHYNFGFDWEPFVTCLRSTITMNHALRTRTSPHRST